MQRKWLKRVSLLLSVAMVLTSVPANTAYAFESNGANTEVDTVFEIETESEEETVIEDSIEQNKDYPYTDLPPIPIFNLLR